MLEKLTIDNYALIEKSVIDFHEGFTVITGETGAGKSIMLGALGLLKGARADSKTMGNKDKKTIVEAVFTNPDPMLLPLFEESGVDWDPGELIVRREISPTGKSRGFINDTPVNLTELSAVSQHLLDIHSQHSNSLLSKPLQQLAIIDAFGKNFNLLEEYKLTFRNYVALRNKVKQLKDTIAQGKENKEFILFRLEQLEKLKPKKGELAELEREFEILGDADRIKSDLAEAYTWIDGGSNSALRQVQMATSLVEGVDLTLFDPDDNDKLLERLNNLKIELRDIADTLETYSDKINSDPERYEKLRMRIEQLYEAMKRFKVKDEEELVSLHNSLKEELDSMSGGKEDLSALEIKLKDKAKELKEKADILSNQREKAVADFSKIVEDRIIPLGMPNAKFQVRIEKGKITAEGQDTVTFFCSFNKNHPMQPISEIASGGEISRVMLVIKSVMAETMNMPTIIFDEIDTGVSGEIAHKMGNMMKDMSRSIQVMAVTHLPQVAANGDRQLKVYKADDNDKTVSLIKELTTEERVNEIAGMLSGNTINNAAIENAKTLLSSK